jgi:hypothetical protein
MSHRLNRLLLALGAAIAVTATTVVASTTVAAAHAVSARTDTARSTAALAADLNIAGQVTLSYSATTNDTLSCTGTCDVPGFLIADWSSYSRTVTDKISGSVTFTVTPGAAYGVVQSPTVPLTESGTYGASGSFTNMEVINCPQEGVGNATETLTGITPGQLKVNSLQVITNSSGQPDLQLSTAISPGVENTYVTETGTCATSFPYVEDVAQQDIIAANQAAGLNPTTGWTINPDWTPEQGGALATKTGAGSAPQPTIGGPFTGTQSAAETWTLTTKPGGVTITSPPDNSTVAVTDGTYVEPQPTADNDVEPAHRFLIVDGTTQCPNVTLNGVTADVTGDTWEAKLPIDDLGPLTLTADASGAPATSAPATSAPATSAPATSVSSSGVTSGTRARLAASDANASCGQATSTTTLINLKITNPVSDGDIEQVNAAPGMPDIAATVQVQGYSGDTSAVSFGWTLDVLGQYIDRHGWHQYDQPFSGSTTGTSASWSPDYGGMVVGGWGKLVVSASLPGVDGTVTSDPRWINMTGQNPGKAAVLSYIATNAGQFADTVSHIMCLESDHTFNQFNPAVNAGETRAAGVPVSLDSPTTFRPLFGAPPAGIGIAQLDPATFPFENWNWQQNVSAGIDEFLFDYQTATTLRNRTQAALNAEFDSVLASVNAQRAAHGLTELTGSAALVPLLSTDQLLNEAIRLYNYSGGEYTFNLTYQQGPDYTVQPVGSPTWVQNRGGSDPDYVRQVQHCRY